MLSHYYDIIHATYKCFGSDLQYSSLSSFSLQNSTEGSFTVISEKAALVTSIYGAKARPKEYLLTMLHFDELGIPSLRACTCSCI